MASKLTGLSYWEMRAVAASMVPRMTVLNRPATSTAAHVGRKFAKFYKEFRLQPVGYKEAAWRVLRDVGIDNALEVSCKAGGCPLPLNLDVWDGQVCPYSCVYCFANLFRSSLYGNFFDQIPQGLRRANFDDWRRDMDGMLKRRGRPAGRENDVRRAITLGLPIRVGVRFENFTKHEAKEGLTLRVLRYLADHAYPVLIDSKSDLLARDDYVRALADNPGGAVVQLSLCMVDDRIGHDLEPGAPPPSARFATLKALNAAGVRAIPRIEPFLPFIADRPGDVGEYIDRCRDSGVTHICWDAFSYSTNSTVTRRLYHVMGYDFDRMFLCSSESRLMTGALLWGIMDLFRSEGFRCSTYDDMGSWDNDDPVCCNTTGALTSSGLNLASTKMAEQFIRKQAGRPVGWADYAAWAHERGGFLSAALERGMHELWNTDGDEAYTLAWAGVQPAGRDQHGIRWRAHQTNPNLEHALRFLEMVHKEGVA